MPGWPGGGVLLGLLKSTDVDVLDFPLLPDVRVALAFAAASAS